MIKTIAPALSLLALALPAGAQQVAILPNGASPAVIGPSSYFTGRAVISPMAPANEHTRASFGLVTFEPGARSHWHTHPAGQILIVTSGKGWTQEEGQPRRDVGPGDVVWCPPGVKHWHGATDSTAMSHIAVTYVLDGQNVAWMEPVTDQQFRHE